MLRILLVKFVLIVATFSLLACQHTNPAKQSPIKIDANIIDKSLSELVKDGEVMGAEALIYSGNQEVYYGAFGYADREVGRLWQRDTLATLYSMTKPITGVTVMSLYEEGLFNLEDPLSKYLPEYADVQVLNGVNLDGTPVLVAPKRPIKVIDIFRQTACFGYGWEDLPASKFMNKAQVLDPLKPLSQFSMELAKVPLCCQPGEQWKYGVAVDVQARLAEVVSGRPYEELVYERVLKPLKMKDTTYFVPPEQKSRLAAVYMRDQDGVLNRHPDTNVYGFRKEKPIQINGGHGLISSIDDYMRFALMLQNEGSLDGVQILKPETVSLMSKDHLPKNITEKDFLTTKGQVGFGLDFAVRIAAPLDENEPFGIEGEFFWDGAASPLFWVDPKNDVTVVFLTQVLPFNMEAQAKFRRAVYETLGLAAVK